MQAHVALRELLIRPQRSVYVCHFISKFQAWPYFCGQVREKKGLMGKKGLALLQGLAELTTRWNIFIMGIRSDSHFFPRQGQQGLMQQASHNGPRCSKYIIKSPLTAACSAKPHGAPRGISAFTIIFHISLKHTTPLSPRIPQTFEIFFTKLFFPPSLSPFTQPTRNTKIGLKLVLNHWLSRQNLQVFRSLEPATEERRVGVGGGCILSFWFQCRPINLW